MNSWYQIFIAYTIFCICVGFLGGYVPMLILLIKERRKASNFDYCVQGREVKCNDGITRLKVDNYERLFTIRRK